MLKKMLSMKRTTKGAISIFLILIFLQSYLFAAVLVDGGRYQMANVMAESALDNATESVLTYYNQLLYDLYGIFALDCSDIGGESGEELNKAIIEKMDNYLKHTLAIIDVDYSAYSSIFAKLLKQDWEGMSSDWNSYKEIVSNTTNELLGNETTKSEIKENYLDMFQFKLENMQGGASVTLANTDYVEDQIIDYMKFRAPLDLVNESTGFIGKIQEILNITKYMEFAKKKLGLTKEEKTKQAYEKADELTEKLKKFRKKVAWVVEFNATEHESNSITKNEIPSRFHISEEVEQIVLEKTTEKVLSQVKGSSEGVIPIYDWLFGMKLKNDETKVLTDLIKDKSKDIAIIIFDDVNNQIEKIKKLKEEVKAIGTEISTITGEGEANTDNIEKLTEIIATYKTKYEQQIINLQSQLSTENSSTQSLYETLNTLNETLTTVSNEIISIEKDIKIKEELEEDISELQIRKENLEEERKNLEQQHSNVESDINELSAEIQKQNKEIGELQEKKTTLVKYQTELEQFKELISMIKEKCSEEAKKELETIQYNFWTILQEAKGYKVTFEQIKIDLEAYIQKLEILQEQQTEEGMSCEDEINAAKSSLGTLISAYAYVDAIIESYQKTPELKVKTDLWKNEIESLKFQIDAALNSATYSEGEQTGYFISNIGQMAAYQATMLCFASETDSKKEKVEVKSTEQIKKDAEEEKKKEEPKGKDLSEVDLKVAYVSGTSDMTQGQDWNVEDDATAYLELGTIMLEFLAQLGESFRDSVYVNQYIISHFPNDVNVSYYKTGDLQEKRLESYNLEENQRIAEVEYIITGQHEYKLNVALIKLYLLTFRTAFNLVSAMMSPTMYQQALSLSAGAGPFAPLAAVAILFAWTVAESTIDVIDLYEKKEVIVLKDSSDWTLSLSGAVAKIIEVGTEAVWGMGEYLYDKGKEAVNLAIYENYNVLKQKGNGVKDSLKNSFVQYMDGYSENLGNNVEGEEDISEETKIVQDAIGEMGDKLVSAGFDRVYENITMVTDSVVFQGVTALNKASDTAMENIKKDYFEGSKLLQEETSEKVTKKLEDKLKGTAVSTSSTTKRKISLEITMNYEEYLNVMLLLTNQQTKIQRVQSLIQLNMRALQSDFSMQSSAVAIWSDVTVSIDFKFMPKTLIPSAFLSEGNEKGKMLFKIHSARSY